MATDTLGPVLAVIVTAASVHDSTGGKRLLDERAASHAPAASQRCSGW
ncbi:hypothetical protein [Streptomyces ortus]